MTHRLGPRLVAALLPFAVLVPGAAHAEKVVTDDPAGDVVTLGADLLGPETGEELVPAPEHTSTDIIRTAVDHRAGRLTVTASLRDLRTSFGETVVMRIRTPQRTWTVYAERRGKQTVTFMSGRRSERPCRGLLTTADNTADTIAVRVPTSCLDDPRWVQLGLGLVGSEVLHDPQTGDRVVSFIDDAYGTGFSDDQGPVPGPRVHRG